MPNLLKIFVAIFIIVVTLSAPALFLFQRHEAKIKEFFRREEPVRQPHKPIEEHLAEAAPKPRLQVSSLGTTVAYPVMDHAVVYEGGVAYKVFLVDDIRTNQGDFHGQQDQSPKRSRSSRRSGQPDPCR